MPNKLHISEEAAAKRHVLSQQVYRLRKRYRRLVSNRLPNNAAMLLVRIRALEARYESLGGYPHHRGNVL